MITLLTSSYRKQQLLDIVTACGPATTVEILFTVIRPVARPSVQVPLSHSIVNSYEDIFVVFIVVVVVLIIY